MEQKTIPFDMSEDMLVRMYNALFEACDYFGALRYLHKKIEMFGGDADDYLALAEAYDDMELFDLSADSWFRYLDVCEEDERVEAYEGLYHCYYHLGNDMMQAFYYKMLKEERERLGEISEDAEYFMDEEEPPAEDKRGKRLRLVWPPEKADHSPDIAEGVAALRCGEYERAAELFSRVPGEAPDAKQAQNYLAVAYLLGGRPEEAEKTCLSLLERDKDDVQALCTYAALLTELERQAESRAVAERLAKIPMSDPDEMYKAATVCCENGLCRVGYEYFKKVEEEAGNDLTLMYFKAVAALRCGEVHASKVALGELLDCKPSAAVARYAFREVARYESEGGQMPAINFFYRVPESERMSRMHLLAMLAQLPREALRSYCEDADITELLEWSLDEGNGNESELPLIGLTVAVRAGYEEFWRGAMLSISVGEAAKMQTLCELCSLNKPFELGMCFAGFYRPIAFNALRTGRVKHMAFVRAYGKCVSRFVPLGIGSSEAFRRAAVRVYAALEREGMLGAAKDEDSLACAIFLAARAGGRRVRDALRLFGAKTATVGAILQAVRGGQAAQEAAAADASAKDEETAASAAEQGAEGATEGEDETH